MAWQLPPDDDIRAFLGTSPPAPDWVIEGIEPGDVGILSAPGGTGKSMFCLSLGASVAGGQPLFGVWQVGNPGDVLYIYAEDKPSTIHRRLKALHQVSPLDASAIDRVHTVCVRSVPPKLMVRGEDRSGIARPQNPELAEIMSRVKRYPNPRLIIIDPLIKFHALDENVNTEMEQFLTLMTKMAEELGVAIILTHHVGKSAVLNGQSSTQQSARGASAIVDQARWQVALSTLDEKYAKKIGIPADDAWKYLNATNPKINGAGRLDDLLLERGPDGVLMRSGLTPTVNPTKPHRRVVSIDDYMEEDQ